MPNALGGRHGVKTLNRYRVNAGERLPEKYLDATTRRWEPLAVPLTPDCYTIALKWS